MVRMSVVYQGEKNCEAIHEPSGSRLETDAPRDNQGKGERFSPTDLVGTALASCILTTIAIVAEREGISVAGSKAQAEKEMVSDPRRIGSLRISVQLPQHLTPEQRKKLEYTAATCPVAKSLHPELQIPMSFTYV